MHRRTAIVTLAGAAAALPPARPIELHVDLEADPAREEELLANFRSVFRPAISRQPGFVAVRLLKLRSVVAGSGPVNMRYRLIISFQTEEQRQLWVKTDDHQKAWPEIEKTLRGAKYAALLYDEV